MKRLAPGEARRVTMRALLCRCARCSHEWASWPREIGVSPTTPTRCPGCKARHWQRVAGPVGRPRKIPA